jgi:hypothetical protein
MTYIRLRVKKRTWPLKINIAPNGPELGTLERKKEADYVIRNAEAQ